MNGNTDSIPKEQSKAVSERVLFALVILAGIIMLIMAVVVNSYLLRFLSPDHNLGRVAIGRTHWSQFRFLVAGVLLIAVAALCHRYGVFANLARRRILTNVVLMIGALVVFMFAANNALVTVFANPRLTTVFIRDDALGWRLRPNADDYYEGGRYIISSKGLRSPHSEYRKPPNTKRILQLGDSATIGNGLPYEETTAYILEAAFADKLKQVSVEVINAACDGYSPWQEGAFLKMEGLEYSPDIVTVGFVLNDVTEKFSLRRFGGHGIGGQLAASRNQHGISDFLFYRIINRTPIYQFITYMSLRIRFGKDIQAGAKRLERLREEDLIFHHDGEVVRQAWAETLEELSGIRQICSENGIQMVLLFIPFEFQVNLPDSMAHPQRTLQDFCVRNGIGYIDITPILVSDMISGNRKSGYYFKDTIHPSAEGNRLIAMAVLDYIENNRLLGEVN